MLSDRALLKKWLAPVSRAKAYRGHLQVEGLLTIEAQDVSRQAFRLRIEFPKTYPTRPPSAYILDRIFERRDHTRHFMSNGSCCLFLRGVNEVWDAADPLALDAWFVEVTLFVVRQLIFDRFGRWPGDKWNHGAAAWDQHVRETVGDEMARHFYEHRRNRISQAGICPCGSGSFFGDCHYSVFEQLKTAISGFRTAAIRDDRQDRSCRYVDQRRNGEANPSH